MAFAIGTPDAAWMRAASKARVDSVVVVVFDHDGDQLRLCRAARPFHGIPNSIDEINHVAAKVDAFSRETSTEEFEITLVRDGVFERWATGVADIKRATAQIVMFWGEYASAENGYQIAKVRLNEIDSRRTTLVLSCVGPFAELEKAPEVRGDFANLHPLEAISAILTAVGRSDLSTSSLAYDTDPLRSHYVVHRSGELSTEQPVIPTETESALENIRDLAAIMNGSLVPSAFGGIEFRPSKVLEDGEGGGDISRHLTPDDYDEVEVLKAYDAINSVRLDVRHGGYEGGVTMRFQEANSVSRLNEVLEASIESRWLEGDSVVSIGSGIGATPSYPETLNLEGPRTSGFAGTRVDKDGSTGTLWTSHPAAARLSISRRGYFLLSDGVAPLEVLFCDELTVSGQASGTYPGVTTTDDCPAFAQLTIDGPSDRGGFGTVENNPVIAGNWVSCITLAVSMALERLERFSDGAPEIRFQTFFRHADLNVGDLITVDADWFFRSQYEDGLDDQTVFEITSREWVFGDFPGIIWTATKAYRLTGAPGKGNKNLVELRVGREVL